MRADAPGDLARQLAMILQRGGVRPVFRAKVGHNQVHARSAVVALGDLGSGQTYASRGGRFAHFIAGAFDNDPVAPALPEGGGLLDVLRHRQSGGVVHDRRELPKIPPQQLCVRVVLDMVEVNHHGHVSVRRMGSRQFAQVGQKQPQPHAPIAAVGVWTLPAGRCP